MLSIENVEVVYHDFVMVLKGLSLQAASGRITALLGTNGAGKTTTLRAAAGILEALDGAVTRGRILFGGEDVTRMPAEERVRRGLSLVMEGRHLFEDLSVMDNLHAGAHLVRSARVVREGIESAFAMFPRLKERAGQKAGFLSGGEQQMLAIARAMMSRPRLLLLDEPSMGLSPLLVQEVCATIARLNREQGVSILLVEQNANFALAIADHAFVMEDGKVVLEGSAAELRQNEDVREFYLGGGGERSFRDLKWYRRRKRWA